MKQKNQYILAAMIQIITIVIYIVSVFVMIGYDAIILNPIPYFLGSAVVILILDALILLRIFKENKLEMRKTDTTTLL